MVRPMVMVATARIRGSPSGIPSCTGIPSPVFGGGVGVIRRRRGHGQPFAAHDPSVADYCATSPEDGGGKASSASLRNSRQLAADGGALHEALVRPRIVVGGAMQEGGIVPDDHVAFAPGVGEDEFRLLGALRQLVEQRLAGGLWPADDEAGMRADIKSAPAVDRVVLE